MKPRSRKSDKKGIERGEMMEIRKKLKKARKHLISCGCVVAPYSK
jgi:hypothetical protein